MTALGLIFGFGLILFALSPLFPSDTPNTRRLTIELGVGWLGIAVIAAVLP